MHAAKIVTFIVWGLTAATGVSIALGVGFKKIQTAPHIPHVDSATYSTAHVTQLLTPSSAPHRSASAAPASSHSGAFKLLGIVYSSNADQSRALLDNSQGTAKAYGVGSILPNGAHITAIAQRSVTLAFNATTQTLELPKK